MKRAKFGPGGNSALFAASGYRSSIDAPEWVVKMELDASEYECGNGVHGSDEAFAMLGINAYQRGVALSLHAPYYISLSGLVPEKRLGSIRYITDSVHAAECLGAEVVVVHAGSASKIDRREAVALAADTLKRAVAECEKTMPTAGNVKIGVETMGKINQLGTLDEVIELCKIDSRLVPVVDFGHLYARSQGTDMISGDDVKRVFQRVSHELGGEIAENMHCHFSCIEYSKGGELKHLSFGNGSFGPEPDIFVKAIAELGVCPTVICESAGSQDVDAKYMKMAYLEALK